jgi:putative transposase
MPLHFLQDRRVNRPQCNVIWGKRHGAFQFCLIMRADPKPQASRADGCDISVIKVFLPEVDMGQIRRDAGYHSAAKAVARLKAGVSGFIADLCAKPKNRVSKKSAYVESHKSLFTEKKVKKTDKSIGDNMDALAGRAVKYAKNLNQSGFDELDKAEDFSVRPSPRTLRRWLAADTAFSVLGLVDQMSKRGNRSSLLGPVERMLMWKHVYKYAHADRPSMKTVHENMSVEFGERNAERAEAEEIALRIPSYETVRRAIHSLDAYEVYLKRHGREAARKKFRPALGGMSIYRPGERIEMDEWTVDSSTICEMPLLMELMTPEERLATGLDGTKARWVITVAIDVATRCILGLVLSRSRLSLLPDRIYMLKVRFFFS